MWCINCGNTKTMITDKSKLVKKKVQRKDGHMTTVWVKPTKEVLKRHFNIPDELYNKVKRQGEGQGHEVDLTKKEMNELLNLISDSEKNFN